MTPARSTAVVMECWNQSFRNLLVSSEYLLNEREKSLYRVSLELLDCYKQYDKLIIITTMSDINHNDITEWFTMNKHDRIDFFSLLVLATSYSGF